MFNTNTMFFSMSGKRKYPLQVLQKPYIEMHLPIVYNNIILVSQTEEQSKEVIVYELYDDIVEKDIFEQHPHPHPQPQIEEPVIETLSIPVKANVEDKCEKVDIDDTDYKKINAYEPPSFVGGSLNQTGKNKKKNIKKGKNNKL